MIYHKSHGLLEQKLGQGDRRLKRPPKPGKASEATRSRKKVVATALGSVAFQAVLLVLAQIGDVVGVMLSHVVEKVY